MKLDVIFHRLFEEWTVRKCKSRKCFSVSCLFKKAIKFVMCSVFIFIIKIIVTVAIKL
jgi:hypothetical protein